MASKKRRRNRSGSKVDDRAIAERELSKGNSKVAVKHARLAYRRDPSETATSLLRRALWHRTRDLYTRKMYEPARAIVAELNDIAVDDSRDAQELRRFQVLLGMGNAQSNGDMLTADPALLSQLVDTAVRDGETAACPNDLLPEVGEIRQALQAVADGQDDQAVTLLQGIGRSSPLADWKLFLRGLIAFYGGDADRRDANWSRLDAERMAYRIAQSLQSATSAPSANRGGEEVEAYRVKTARLALDSPLARQLRQLQTAVQEGTRWASLFGNLKREFGQSHPVVLEQVSEILASKFITQNDHDKFERLRTLKPPFRLDPNMSRATALFHEEEDEIDDAMKAWKQYIRDLSDCEHLNESRRRTAIALVYLHLARLCAAEASELDDAEHAFWSGWAAESIADQVESYRHAADGYFTASREHDPGLQAAYLGHCRLLCDWTQTERASRLYRELASRFQDDFHVQLEAALHYRQDARDPGKAQQYARQAEKLRPRDPQVVQLFWDCAFDCARIAARQRQFGIPRSELDQAAQYVGPGRESYVLHAMRAAVELKAGNVQGADRNQELACSEPELAPAATLALCANAFQCGVGSGVRRELNAQLKAATSSRPHPIAGGAMARFLISLNSADVTYHGFKTHEKLVSTYLKKCPKKQWRESDLIDAMEFAVGRDCSLDLLGRFSKIGCKFFPTNPRFRMGMGQYEMSRGPRCCNRPKAIGHFKAAIQLNKDSESHQLDRSDLEFASRSVALLEMPPGAPMFGDPMFGDLGPPPDIDFDELFDSEGLPPELVEMMDHFGISPRDIIESAMRGESPGELMERHGGKAN